MRLSPPLKRVLQSSPRLSKRSLLVMIMMTLPSTVSFYIASAKGDFTPLVAEFNWKMKPRFPTPQYDYSLCYLNPESYLTTGGKSDGQNGANCPALPRSVTLNSFSVVVPTGIDTTLDLGCGPTVGSTLTVGVPLQCIVYVLPAVVPPTIPTGQVIFSPGGGTCIVEPDQRGNPECDSLITPTGPGILTITVSYGGDSLFNPSSATTTVAVHPRTTIFGIVCTSPVVIDQDSTCTATVDDNTPGGTSFNPVGVVEFHFSGVTRLCSLSAGTIAGEATCSTRFTESTRGPANVTGSYDGDSVHSGSPAAIATVNVNLRAASTTLNCSPASALVGTPVTCSVTVTDASPGTAIVPMGTVTFASGTAPSSDFASISCTLQGGVCSVIFTPSATGSQGPIIASFGGDASHNLATGHASVVVNPPPRQSPPSGVDLYFASPLRWFTLLPAVLGIPLALIMRKRKKRMA